MSLEQCLAISDVVISAVPNSQYKVKTEWLKEGCICLNIAADKNFEMDVREKVSYELIFAKDWNVHGVLRHPYMSQQSERSPS
jgi:methylenetetrahydrofolate dehydrogenase (NAD+)